jgi:hypothetical protein
MVLLKRRSRLVTFRVSAEEYEALTKTCLDNRVRSIAEFARAAVLQKLQAAQAPSSSLSGDLITLSRGLHDLDVLLADARKRIRGILGPVRSGASAGGDHDTSSEDQT